MATSPLFPGYSPEQIAILNRLIPGGTGVTGLPGGPGKGVTRQPELTLGPPPPGTYDSALDYNAGAASRGFTQTQNDADTAFEQGQQDYKLNLGELDQGHTRGLQDYGFQTSELGRNYGILGRQQAEGAAQRGVTSAGLLGKSSQIRGANQAREQGQLDLGRDRLNEDYTDNKTRLDLGNARTFGGYKGTEIINPLTGKAETGSLLTGTQRAFTENDAYQGAILGQKTQQAAAGGYVSPLIDPKFDPEDYKKRLAAFMKGQG